MSEKQQADQYRSEWALVILKLVYSRRNHLNGVLRLTKEISESLSRNDKVSVQMLLKMRGQELEEVGDSVQKLQVFIAQLPQATQREINGLLQGQRLEQQDEHLDKIIDTVNTCKKTLEETIALDKRMSKRVAGSDSFYE